MAYIRRIKLPHLYNFRDLGGYQGEGGCVTAWNRLYRCDCPDSLEEKEWLQLRDRGIKTLIDLRSTYEASEKPVTAPYDFRYLDGHFFNEKAGSALTGDAGKKFLESLSLDYRVMMKTSVNRVTLILRTITESLRHGNTVFFCTAGKDRTGIVAAEILRICGVSDDDIIADYSITEVYNEEVIRARIESLPKEILEQVSPETMAKAAASKPETMREYLAWRDRFCYSFEMQKELKNLLLTEN